MEQLASFVAAKRRIARRYDDELGGLPGAGRFPRPEWAESACWFSGVTLTRPTVAEIRPLLRARGVDSRPFWKPIHLQAPYRDAPRAAFPVCEPLWPTILTLPCSTGLTDAEQDTVIAAVRDCLAR
jgi:dTDP-4-amino-4,6-dideoxygalactose transaminase